MEKKIEKQAHEKPISPKLAAPVQTLDVDPLSVSLEVGPGDFKAAFALTNHNPAPDGYEQELVFALHDLDGNPSVIKRGRLTYPPKLMRRGLEGEVKLLVLIDEKEKSAFSKSCHPPPGLCRTFPQSSRRFRLRTTETQWRSRQSSILSAHSFHLARLMKTLLLFLAGLPLVSVHGFAPDHELTKDFGIILISWKASWEAMDSAAKSSPR